MSLGQTLLELRTKNGMSLQQVADMVGISKTHIWALEKEHSNNPSLELLKKLADVFKVPVEYLAGTISAAEKSIDDAQAARFVRHFNQLGEDERRILQETLDNFLSKKPRIENDQARLSGDKYNSFKQLCLDEVRGVDYDFEWERVAHSSIVVLAPHGGTIEPKTDQIARDIAGSEFSFYCFRALKPDSRLHIASHLFDEPECLRLVATHQRAISIHGWATKGVKLCIGGRDVLLAEELRKAFIEVGLKVETAKAHLAGTSPENIVNRTQTGLGVQMELSMELRSSAEWVRPLVSTARRVLAIYAQTKGAEP